MQNKKLRIFTCIICAILTLATMFLSCIFYTLNCSYYIGSRVVVDKKNNLISVTDNNDIRILQLSDTQITGLGDSLKCLDIITKTIETAQPDLIVLTGDNLMDGSKKAMLKKYIRFMDKFGIPWAPVMGNHDYHVAVSMDEQCELYSSGKYCLFQKGTVVNSYGNYYYNISRNGEQVYSLVFMDNAVKFGHEHLDWYTNTINSIKNQNGKTLPSFTFFHKPLMQTYYAYYNSIYSSLPIDGEMREMISFLWDDDGFFHHAKSLNSVTAMIYGHNHRNSYICDYMGIKMCFGLKTGKTSYYDRDLIGGNLFILKSDNTFNIERIFV